MDNDTQHIANGICNIDPHDAHPYEPVAIIGMGMRLPGRIHNAADYWNLLVNGKSGRCRVPKSRYNVDTWYGPGRASHVPSEYGYFLEDLNLAHVDPNFWSFTKQEAELMDPRQRLFLEVAYEALENSGTTTWRGKDVGVYVGTMGEDWNQLESRDEQSVQKVRPDVYGDYIIANRASYEFDLTGPSVVVRTACSASLVALHQACRDLHSGDCSSALVGGVNLILTPKDTVIMHQNGVLSPSSCCKTFDADADGFARGEGVTAIYIKKLSHAVRDGDPVRAVIRSTCIAGNGRTSGLTTPNPKIHERLMRRGHKLAGIADLSKTAMVECHGTGTSVGDPLEVSAVANIWGDHGIYIGSVKPNIGHGEGASGLSSVIKMVLALENSTIPPNINFKNPNPRIPWGSARLQVPTEPLPWPTDRYERVSVNSFGIGGSNAHVLLESAACFGLPSNRLTNCLKLGALSHRLLAFSAQHPESVQAMLQGVEGYLNRSPESLNDVASSLASRRELHSYRAFCVTDGITPLQISPIIKSGTKSPDVIWAFTGQGAQWAQMGKALLEQDPLFKQRIDTLNSVLAALPYPPLWNLADLLLAPKEESRLDEAEYSQPCLVAIQVALVDVLRSWGVTPTAVVGHSSGETAAAYATGAITAKEAMLIAYHRGQITRLIKDAHNGSMAAVGLGRKQIEPFLRPGVIIGCENSPENVTLSGECDILADILGEIRPQYPEVLIRSLCVECGYHSHHMKAAAADFTSRLEGLLQNKEPLIPFYSSVTGKRNTDMSHKYWVQNVVSPVLFNTAVQTVLDDFESPIFVEIGPHSALAGPVRQILHSKNRTAQYISTLLRNQDAVSTVLKAAGDLWLAGAAINIAAVNPLGEYLNNLPTYPWQYDEVYWVESRLSRSWRLREYPHHELLGSRVQEIGDACPAWRCILKVEDVPWLRDHVIQDEMVFPASGFICMVGEALRQLQRSVDFTFRQVSIEAALVINDQPVELVTVINPSQTTGPSQPRWYDFSVSSLAESSKTWVKHISGQCRAGSDHKRLAPDMGSLPRKVSSKSFYNTWKRFGLNYGTSFRGLANVSSHVTEAKAMATLDHQLAAYSNSVYPIHPATLDTSMHVAMISACQGLERNFRRLAVPTYIHEVYIGKPTGQVQVVATANVKSHATAASNIVGLSDGKVVVDISGLQVSALGERLESERDDPHAGAVLTWLPDIDFISPSYLLRPRHVDDNLRLLDQLTLACIVDLRAQLEFLPVTHPHFVNFKSWLDSSYNEAVTRQCHGVVNSFDIATMNHKSRLELIGILTKACKGTTASDISQAISRVHKYVRDYFSGSPCAVDTLTQPSHFTGSSEFIADVDCSDGFRLLGHKKPNMSILHIGVGAEIDDVSSAFFSSKGGHRPYRTYIYTSVSAKPSELLEKRFDSVPAASYRQLMIETDPILQGFKEASFDLIISEPKLGSVSEAAIINMRRLLKPRGHLFLQHSNPASKVLQLAYGLSHEFHLGPESPLHEHHLRDQMSRAGFNDTSVVTFTGEFGRVTIATLCLQTSKIRKASVLCQDTNHALVADAAKSMRSHGISQEFFSSGQELPLGQPVICLLDLESPFLHDMTDTQWGGLKKSLLSAQDETLLWVTVASQVDCKDPRYALTLGLTRSIRRELSMDLVTLELDRFDVNGWDAMTTLFEGLGDRVSGGDTEPDSEYVFSNGLIQICRFQHVQVSDELRERCDSATKYLKIVKPGALQTLSWEEADAVFLSGDLLQVEVKAAGLNTKDLHVSLGSFPSHNNCSSDFGLEGSGVVIAVGTEARRFRVGDRVAFNYGGSLSTSVVLSETLCAAIPDAMTFEEAASTPYSYCTVIYGLLELGRLKKGQSVLIRSAYDALGLAAIQVATLIGAKIFCSAQSSGQVEYLMSSYGIARDHIVSHKDSYLSPEMMRLTDGRGVDIVFSTLSGLIQESWDCVASFGTMVQVWQGTTREEDLLQMDQSSRSRSFVGVDLVELRASKPRECTRLLEQAFLFLKFGLNQPPQPTRLFPVSDMCLALQYMRTEERIGRVVVTMPHDSKELRASPLRSQIALRSDRTYIIVGGLGGLGQATARFLVEKGARHLIFFSRSAEEFAKSRSEYFNELAFLGCEAQAISGSVNDIADVVKMIDSAPTPVGGVLHAAMVLQDVHFADMTFEQWQTAVSPKVQGTWNLHHALQEQREPLDFFFLFSSLSGLGGQIGQANYAAGNGFLDAFVQYRHSLGLACSVLDIGIMEDIGVLARETHRLDALRATSQHCLHEQDLLDALELMMLRSHTSVKGQDHQQNSSIECYTNPSQLAIGMRTSSSANRTGWQRDPRAGFLAKTVSAHQHIDHHGPGRTMKQYLQSCILDPAKLETDEAKELLANEVGAALRGFMMRQDEEVDLSRPLQTDSLVTVELRNWFRRKMGVVLNIHEMLKAESILALGGLAGMRLAAVYRAGAQDFVV